MEAAEDGQVTKFPTTRQFVLGIRANGADHGGLKSFGTITDILRYDLLVSHGRDVTTPNQHPGWSHPV